MSVGSPDSEVYDTPGGTIIDSVRDHYHLCDNGLMVGCLFFKGVVAKTLGIFLMSVSSPRRGV
jgi:predicted DNA-binding protein with PD1-like motif